MEHLSKKDIELIVNSNYEPIREAIEIIAKYIRDKAQIHDTCHHGIRDLIDVIMDKIIEEWSKITPPEITEKYAQMLIIEQMIKSGDLPDDDTSPNIIHIYN